MFVNIKAVNPYSVNHFVADTFRTYDDFTAKITVYASLKPQVHRIPPKGLLILMKSCSVAYSNSTNKLIMR